MIRFGKRYVQTKGGSSLGPCKIHHKLDQTIHNSQIIYPLNIMGFLNSVTSSLGPALSTGMSSLGSSRMGNKLMGSLTSGNMKGKLLGSVKNTVIGLIQKVVDKYKDNACSNPNAFLDQVIADLLASKIPGTRIVRMGIEMHRAQIASEMNTILAEPEFQQACKNADVRKIADEIFGALEQGGALSGDGSSAPPQMGGKTRNRKSRKSRNRNRNRKSRNRNRNRK